MYTNLEWGLAVVFVDDAEGADFGTDGPDFRRDIDNQLIFVDQTVVAAGTPGRPIQTGY